MKKTTWNTYKTTTYSHDVAQDQRSAGGVHHHQVRLSNKIGWQKRIIQTNGVHSAAGPVSEMCDSEGESAFESAKN